MLSSESGAIDLARNPAGASNQDQSLLNNQLIRYGLIYISIAAVWIIALSRAVPTRLGDRGIFVSVAESILRGGTLYVTAYDNKEPLFLYFVAIQRALGDWAELVAEVGLIGIASFSSYVIARMLAEREASLIVGFIIVPIVLTGVFYFPGATHLPSTALVLAMLAALMSRYPLVAGAMFGLLVFMKIPAIPVALASACALLAVRGSIPCFIRFGVASLGVACCIILFMGARLELVPFIETIKGNILYAHGNVVGNAGVIRGMIARIMLILGQNVYLVLAAIAAAFSIGLITASGDSKPDRGFNEVFLIGVVACAATILSLSLTGLWHHHNQLLYIAACLAAIAMVQFISKSMKSAFYATMIVCFCFAYFLAGAFPLRAHFNNMVELKKNYDSLSEVSPEALKLLTLGASGSYARFGRYDERGHAAALPGWRMSCARFHQGQHESEAILNRVFECASKSRVLLVGADFRVDTPDKWPDWKEFVGRVDDLLASKYICDAEAGLRVCVRK